MLLRAQWTISATVPVSYKQWAGEAHPHGTHVAHGAISARHGVPCLLP